MEIEVDDKQVRPEIKIDLYAIRFIDERGQCNFFFCNMIHNKNWGHDVLSKIHEFYEKCLISGFDPEGDEDGA